MHLFCRVALCTVAAVLPRDLAGQTDAVAVHEVARLVARYDSAWNRRDSLTVNGLLSPNYQYFSSRGSVSSRAETMKFLSDPGYRLERAGRSELAVTLSGAVAVVSSRWQGQGSYRGERFVDDQRCGQTWVRNGPAWQLLNEHCVQIAPRGPQQADSVSP
jgi:Domain of unknown function (DUF4440)